MAGRTDVHDESVAEVRRPRRRAADAAPAGEQRSRRSGGDVDSAGRNPKDADNANKSARRAERAGFLARFAVDPDTAGPRVRLGVLWFILALAAGTAGRWWAAAFWALTAARAGLGIVGAWHPHRVVLTGTNRREPGPVNGSRLPELVAALLAGSVPLAAGYSTGAAGAALIIAGVLALVLSSLLRGPRGWNALAIGVVLPAVAAAAVVLVVRSGLWAGLFLVMAVSLYDAGSFLAGAESTSRVEGPIAGMVGTLAVTFTMAAFQAPPFDVTSAWITGAVVAVTCPIGQWIATACLPSPSSRSPGLRRLDAYLVAAPLFLASVWLFT